MINNRSRATTRCMHPGSWRGLLLDFRSCRSALDRLGGYAISEGDLRIVLAAGGAELLGDALDALGSDLLLSAFGVLEHAALRACASVFLRRRGAAPRIRFGFVSLRFRFRRSCVGRMTASCRTYGRQLFELVPVSI